jgi:FKBP-type peptidyl-prolyl cis-trans isomerase FkpA
MNDQQAYLIRNAQEDGVDVRSSGLQIRHDRVGEGKQPGAKSTVTVHYRGSLIDGSVFDASYDRGAPLTFRLDQVIRGWTEGLQQMREGGKATLVIPATLGYGDGGAGDDIPPGATLVFEVELLKVL